VPALSAPTIAVHASFLEAMREFQAEGRGGPDDHTGIGIEIRVFSDEWDDPAWFARYVVWLMGLSTEEGPKPEGWVPATTLWWVEGTEYLGRLNIRHRLTPYLLEAGGHIGYDVRRSARRRGHATAMLARGLPVAARLGIESALITCDVDNVGSRRVIESNGGVFEDEREGKLRYWIPTGLSTPGGVAG
jgi:predicted acetyltransferase